MEKTNEKLYAISPIIDYKDFYLSYHKRRNPIYLQKEYEFPKIKINALKTEIYAKECDKDYNINNLFKKNFINNSVDNYIDNNKTNSFNYSINGPFIKTEQICYPKLNPILRQIKKFMSPFKTKIPKKIGKLSIKYLDIINMDSKNNILFYELNKNEKLFENEIINNIDDSFIKTKIINELKNIDKNMNQQIENIVNNTENEDKDFYFDNFNIHPKIIYLSAEEIFKQFNKEKDKNTEINTDIQDNFKIKKNDNKKLKIKERRENPLNDTLLDYAKNNIKRKIEIRNQFNQELSIEYIERLLKIEIEKIKILLALIYYNKSENHKRNLSYNSENTKNKNTLNNYCNRYFKLNNYYNSLISLNYRNNNEKIANNKKYFNTIDKSKLNNNRYNTNKEYMELLMNQLSSNKEDERDNNEKNDKNTNVVVNKNKNLFYQYNKNKMYSYAKLSKPNLKTLNNNILINRKKLIPIKVKLDSKNNELNEENNIKIKNIYNHNNNSKSMVTESKHNKNNLIFNKRTNGINDDNKNNNNNNYNNNDNNIDK